MTQFKMPSGTYDPLWLISRLNTAGNKSQQAYTGIHVSRNLEQSMVQDLKHIILLLTGNNWNIVLCGHISWTAHVNIIDWRSLECQICNSRLITLKFWLCEKWVACVAAGPRIRILRISAQKLVLISSRVARTYVFSHTYSPLKPSRFCSAVAAV